MTRGYVNRPVWAWHCDQCGDLGDDLGFRQQDLPSKEQMREKGWEISPGMAPLRDLCPTCVAGREHEGVGA